MAFTGWLRHNSEHYLLIDAQRRVAKKYGRPGPPEPRTLEERFWLQVFAPVYHVLPWKLRQLTIKSMPGSHRQKWTFPTPRGVPAIGGDGRPPSLAQRSQSPTVTNIRGE